VGAPSTAKIASTCTWRDAMQPRSSYRRLGGGCGSVWCPWGHDTDCTVFRQDDGKLLRLSSLVFKRAQQKYASFLQGPSKIGLSCLLFDRESLAGEKRWFEWKLFKFARNLQMFSCRFQPRNFDVEFLDRTLKSAVIHFLILIRWWTFGQTKASCKQKVQVYRACTIKIVGTP